MAEQLVNMGTAIGYAPYSTSFVLISDGYFEVHAYIPAGTIVQIGRCYQVFKQGNTYYVGAEVRA